MVADPELKHPAPEPPVVDTPKSPVRPKGTPSGEVKQNQEQNDNKPGKKGETGVNPEELAKRQQEAAKIQAVLDRLGAGNVDAAQIVDLMGDLAGGDVNVALTKLKEAVNGAPMMVATRAVRGVNGQSEQTDQTYNERFDYHHKKAIEQMNALEASGVAIKNKGGLADLVASSNVLNEMGEDPSIGNGAPEQSNLGQAVKEVKSAAEKALVEEIMQAEADGGNPTTEESLHEEIAQLTERVKELEAKRKKDAKTAGDDEETPKEKTAMEKFWEKHPKLKKTATIYSLLILLMGVAAVMILKGSTQEGR